MGTEEAQPLKSNAAPGHSESLVASLTTNKPLRFFSWEDLVGLLIVAFFLILNQTILSGLNQLPSPLYGGDYYNHMGTIEHLVQGGSLFHSGQMLGEIQWVPWLYHLLVSGFTLALGTTPMYGIIYFSQLALIAGAIITYFLISRFFKNKIFGLIALLWYGTNFPIFKYSPFSFYVILPLFILAAYSFMKKQSLLNAAFLGLTYGLAGLSNTFMFIQNSFFIGIFILHYLWSGSISIKGKISISWKHLMEKIPKAATIFFLGFAICLLWWYAPILIYHAHTANDMQIYGFREIKGFGDMLGLVMTGLKSQVFVFNSLKNTVLHIGALLGILFLFFLKKKKEEHTLLAIMLFSAFFGLCVHFISVPVMGTLLGSVGLFDVGMIFTNLLLFFLGLDVISKNASRLNQYLGIATVILAALLFSISVGQQFQEYSSDQYYQMAKNQISPHLLATRDWVLKNTQLNDVFLTTNEDSFVLNALTGRKIVAYRRTHASPYADVNQRMLDAGLMLYSNNDSLRNELLNKYSVDYLYWQPGWISNEFRLNDQGQIASFFDPLMIEYTPAREKILKENNVTAIKLNTYLDPAWLPEFPKRDVLIILPARPDAEKPWSDTLDKYLSLEKEILINGQIGGRIYSINKANQSEWANQINQINQGNQVNQNNPINQNNPVKQE